MTIILTLLSRSMAPINIFLLFPPSFPSPSAWRTTRAVVHNHLL